jgi:hypothetical protein
MALTNPFKKTRSVKGVAKGASVGMLGLIMGNPIVIAVILIVMVALFVFAYATLWSLGLLTASIFFIAGLSLVFIVVSKTPEVVKTHPLVFFFTPIVLGAFGYVTNKVPALSEESWMSNNSPVFSPIVIALVLAIIALLLLIVAYKARPHRRRRH